jgi:hypothetical protein
MESGSFVVALTWWCYTQNQRHWGCQQRRNEDDMARVSYPVTCRHWRNRPPGSRNNVGSRTVDAPLRHRPGFGCGLLVFLARRVDKTQVATQVFRDLDVNRGRLLPPTTGDVLDTTVAAASVNAVPAIERVRTILAVFHGQTPLYGRQEDFVGFDGVIPCEEAMAEMNDVRQPLSPFYPIVPRNANKELVKLLPGCHNREGEVLC